LRAGDAWNWHTLQAVMLCVGVPCSKNEYIKVNYGQQPFKFDLEVSLGQPFALSTASVSSEFCLRHSSRAVLSLRGVVACRLQELGIQYYDLHPNRFNQTAV
jgi:hypothetical protein